MAPKATRGRSRGGGPGIRNFAYDEPVSGPDRPVASDATDASDTADGSAGIDPSAGADWLAWHQPYDDPSSPLSRRLTYVHEEVRRALDAGPPGPLRVVSICAGQGRDVIGALAGHPRAVETTARLVELDERNVALARAMAAEARLGGVTVVRGDASTTDAYAGAVPAHVVVVCGVFGNVVQGDISRTVVLLRGLCAPGATVIWTRHRRPPDMTPAIRGWFEESGFAEVAFHAPEGFLFGVGAHRLTGFPSPFVPGIRLFSFVGNGSRPA